MISAGARWKRRLLDAEAARIARWFGETELGPVYFDRAGRALPVTDRQRERWRLQAERDVARYAARLNRTPLESVLIAFVLAVAAFAAAALLEAFGLPVGINPGLAALPAMLWPGVVGLRFRTAQRRFRHDVEMRLALRTPVPEAVAVSGRRYNIFAAGQTIAGIAALAIAALAALRDQPLYGRWAMLALVALGWLLFWAGRRVDAVHRRKSC